VTESETARSEDQPTDESPPVMQQLFDSIWLLAGAAILFFTLSYIVWGFIDLLTIPLGG
jgi:hypothetical protein